MTRSDDSTADRGSAERSRSASRQDEKSTRATNGNGSGSDFHADWLDDTGRRDAARPTPADPVTSLADGLRDAAQSTVRAAKEQASAIAGEVGHELGKTTEEQMGRGAEAIHGFARAIEAAGNELEEQSPALARTINEWAGKVDAFSDGLGRRQLNELLDAATGIAKNQPAAFLGAAVATGFVLARFLKSSKHATSFGDSFASARAASGANNDRH